MLDQPTCHKYILVGTVVSNPHSESAIALILKFSHFGQRDRPIVYPPLETVIQCAAEEMFHENEYGTIGKFDMVSRVECSVI